MGSEAMNTLGLGGGNKQEEGVFGGESKKIKDSLQRTRILESNMSRVEGFVNNGKDNR